VKQRTEKADEATSGNEVDGKGVEATSDGI